MFATVLCVGTYNCIISTVEVEFVANLCLLVVWYNHARPVEGGGKLLPVPLSHPRCFSLQTKYITFST